MYIETTARATAKLRRELEAQGYETIVTREVRYIAAKRRRQRVYVIHCRYIGC